MKKRLCPFLFNYDEIDLAQYYGCVEEKCALYNKTANECHIVSISKMSAKIVVEQLEEKLR